MYWNLIMIKRFLSNYYSVTVCCYSSYYWFYLTLLVFAFWLGHRIVRIYFHDRYCCILVRVNVIGPLKVTKSKFNFPSLFVIRLWPLISWSHWTHPNRIRDSVVTRHNTVRRNDWNRKIDIIVRKICLILFKKSRLSHRLHYRRII